jgi:Ca2+-binding RTX toxin-like protein
MQLTTRRATAGVVAALALVPAAAMAATIEGGPGNEHLRGTNGPDQISGNGGNDRIFGFRDNDQLRGGPGNDRVFGGRGNDLVSGDANDAGDRTSFDFLSGGSGDDTLNGGDSRDRMHGMSGNDTANGENGHDKMSGGTGNDTQSGGPGNDLIFANLGQDTTSGGDGNDRLWALARGDVQPGPNGETDQTGDALDGGAGNDSFRVRDGEVDRVTCGEGNDVAFLDDVDVITDADPAAGNHNGSCERVIRQAPRSRDSKSEDAQQAPASANQ